MYKFTPSVKTLDLAAWTVGTCAGGTHDLPIEHLQLHETTTITVWSLGSKTISQLAKKLTRKGQTYEFFLCKDRYSKENARSLINLASVCENGKFNWPCYWESIGYRFNFPAMKLDDIQNLSGVDLNFDISHLNLGKAEFLIRKNGITTCGSLIVALSKGFSVPTGFGANKLQLLARGMIEFLKNPLSVENQSYSFQKSKSPDNEKIFAPVMPQISSATSRLALEAIHLSTQVPKLNSIGVNNVGTLLDVLQRGLPKIRSIGRTSLEKINKVVAALKKSLDQNGDVDWHRFSIACGYPVVPVPHIRIPDGNAFLSILPEVTDTLARECFDDVESAALQERLIQRNATSLESLGKQFGMTRERIRQKQKYVLNSISSALLDGNYADMDFRFSEQFSGYWRRAASHFGETESLDYYDFLSGLSVAWNIDSSQLLPHLPLIYCVLTKDSRLPAHFKANAKIPVRVFNISEADAARPIVSLHPSPTLSRSCESGGYVNLGDLVQKLRDPEDSLPENIRERLLSDVLQHFVIDENNIIDWDKYFFNKGIKFLPQHEIVSKEDFADSMTDAILKFASDLNWSMATTVIQHRSIPPTAARKTLNETAEMLDTNGPTIKRTETEVLAAINDAIFRDDYVGRQYRFQPGFVAFFKEAQLITSSSNSIENATNLLREAWKLDSISLDKITPLLCSVIKRYPPGYPGKRKDSETNGAKRFQPKFQSQPKTTSFGTIKLRGFRSVC